MLASQGTESGPRGPSPWLTTSPQALLRRQEESLAAATRSLEKLGVRARVTRRDLREPLRRLETEVAQQGEAAVALAAKLKQLEEDARSSADLMVGLQGLSARHFDLVAKLAKRQGDVEDGLARLRKEMAAGAQAPRAAPVAQQQVSRAPPAAAPAPDPWGSSGQRIGPVPSRPVESTRPAAPAPQMPRADTAAAAREAPVPAPATPRPAPAPYVHIPVNSTSPSPGPIQAQGRRRPRDGFRGYGDISAGTTGSSRPPFDGGHSQEAKPAAPAAPAAGSLRAGPETGERRSGDTFLYSFDSQGASSAPDSHRPTPASGEENTRPGQSAAPASEQSSDRGRPRDGFKTFGSGL